MGEFITIVYANVQREVRKRQTDSVEVWYNEAKNAKGAVFPDVYRSYDEDEHFPDCHGSDVRLQFTHDLCKENDQCVSAIFGQDIRIFNATCNFCHDSDRYFCIRRGKNVSTNASDTRWEPRVACGAEPDGGRYRQKT
jgi:hypothetical protein